MFYERAALSSPERAYSVWLLCILHLASCILQLLAVSAPALFLVAAREPGAEIDLHPASSNDDGLVAL